MLKRLLQRLQTKGRVLCIRQHPRHHITAKPIENRDEKHKAPVQGNICHIGAPHVIRPVNHEIPQQIGIDRVSRMRPACVGAWRHPFHTHQPHEALDPFAIDVLA